MISDQDSHQSWRGNDDISQWHRVSICVGSPMSSLVFTGFSIVDKMSLFSTE